LIASTVADCEKPHGPVSGKHARAEAADRVVMPTAKASRATALGKFGGAVMADDVRGQEDSIGDKENTVGEILRRTQTGCQKVQGDRRVGTTERLPNCRSRPRRSAQGRTWPAM
jgi:hypothetical protein